MHGKKIQPTAPLLERKARRKGGFSLSKSQGMDVPMTPPTAAMVMHWTERRKIVVHESVCECGGRAVRVATMAAERQPVMTSDQMLDEFAGG